MTTMASTTSMMIVYVAGTIGQRVRRPTTMVTVARMVEKMMMMTTMACSTEMLWVVSSIPVRPEILVGHQMRTMIVTEMVAEMPQKTPTTMGMKSQTVTTIVHLVHSAGNSIGKVSLQPTLTGMVAGISTRMMTMMETPSPMPAMHAHAE